MTKRTNDYQVTVEVSITDEKPVDLAKKLERSLAMYLVQNYIPGIRYVEIKTLVKVGD